MLLNDAMSRPTRTAAPTTAGAQWFVVGPGTTASYAPGALAVTNAGAAQFLGYFTPTASPVKLKVGQSVTLTFTFTLTGTLGATTDATAFRMGLFNSGGTRISGDITTLSSSSSFERYAGYAMMCSPTTSGQSIRKRIELAATNKNNLIGTASTVYGSALVSGPSQTLRTGVDYLAVISANRTQSGLEFLVLLAGEGLVDYGIFYLDPAAESVTTFDTLAFGWSNGMLTGGGGVTLKSLTVTATPPVHPPGTADADRPFIWVRSSEKAAILAKISGQAWATSHFNTLVSRTSAEVTRHQNNRDSVLRELPVRWEMSPARFKTMPEYDRASVRDSAMEKFDLALDSAVLFYITGDLKYARYAADILHNSLRTLAVVSPSTNLDNGGWIIQDDFLLEARVLGTQLPIIYDFVRPFLANNQVHDVQAGGLVSFNYTTAQLVFRTYYELARDHGQPESNWSALMSTCMLNNLLALNDPAERTTAMEVFLTRGTDRQSSLDNDYRNYPAPSSIWPESLQYAVDVVTSRTTQLVMLDRYDPTMNLLQTYPNYPASLERPSVLLYPNGQQVSFGDGPRNSPGEPFFEYELVYQQAKATGQTALAGEFGARIALGVQSGRYNRAALPAYSALGMHNEPLQLLLFAPTVQEAAIPLVLPRTDHVPHAGVFLQRNEVSQNNSRYGLMCFVGGAGFIHSHASGMSMELYGLGYVLGAKSGRTTYQTPENENYYRVFASNNTVVVNGASQGSGGWNGLSINTVQLVASEPAIGSEGVSANHSFSTSTFSDDRGTGAEAQQQRTLGIVRTSATTGYYVDIFRSDSSLANEFHDYIYRNVGDSVTLMAGSVALPLTSSPNRFQTDIGDSREQPGWRYFTETEVSNQTSSSITARFTATLPAGVTNMTLFMPGAAGRSYARVKSPRIVDAPSPYNSRLAPTLVARQSGSAWNQPFAAVFEPHLGAGTTNSVRGVSKIESAGLLVGLKVESVVGSRQVIQYVFSLPTAAGSFSDPALGIVFEGRYAVATDNGDGSGSLYIGDGSRLSFKGYTVRSAVAGNTKAHLSFGPGQSPTLTGDASFEFPATTNEIERWRLHWFASPADAGMGADVANPDGDNWSNAQEYELGSNPLLPDGWEPLSISRTGGNLLLSFLAVSASGPGYEGLTRRYSLESTTNLASGASWSGLSGYTGLPGNDARVSVSLSPPVTAQFFRLRVELRAP